jgi:hypothetical protein
MAPQHRDFSSIILVCLAYILLTLATTHPLWLDFAGTLPGDIGDPLGTAWIVAWDIHALLTDPTHLFDANTFFPQKNTLAYAEHLFGTALMGVPVFLFTRGEPVPTYNAIFLLSFVLTGLGTYLLVQHYTGNKPAAFLAGVAFAFGPYRFAALVHLQLLVVQWLPFALLFLDRYLQHGRWYDLTFFTFFVWLQVTSSWHLGVFTAFIVCFYLAWYWLLCRETFTRRRWGELLVSAMIIFLGLLPFTLPYLAVAELRIQRPPEVAAPFSAVLGDYLAAVPTNLLLGPVTAPFRERLGFNIEHYLFLGFLVPLLALASLFLWRGKTQPGASRLTSRQYLALLWLIVVLSISFTFGPRVYIDGRGILTPYGLLQQLIPLLSLIRVSARWIIAADFAMSLLGGYVLARFFSRLREQWKWRLGVPLLTALLGLLFLVEGYSVPIPTAQIGTLNNLPLVYHWIRSDPDPFAILEIPLYAPPLQEYPEAKRMYASTLHWKRLVNGFSGITPAFYRRLGEVLQDFPALTAVRATEELGRQGLRYVVVHSLEENFDRKQWEEKGVYQAVRSGTLFFRYTAQGDYVYEVNPYGAGLFTTQESLADPRWQALARQRVGADFAGKVTLLGYEVQEERESLALSLYWQAREPLAADYTVFVHLLDASGAKIAQADSPPDEGRYPTTAWEPGEVVRDVHRIPLTEAKGGSHFVVGLYLLATMERLPVTDATGQTKDSIVLAR